MKLDPIAIDGWREGFIEAVDPQAALGALLGLAVGDALGTTHEFKALAAPRFPELALGPLTEIVGGGPFRLEPGQVTDDTQMAAALADRLSKSKGKMSLEDLVVSYLRWSKVCFDIGSQTHRALDAAERGADATEAGRAVWDQAESRKPAGNGSLMRTAPIGVFLAKLGEPRRLLSLAESSITHADPRCMLACAAFNGAIARALTSNVGPADLAATAAVELERAYAMARRVHPDLGRPIEEARGELESDLEAAVHDDPQLYGADLHIHEMQGFVRVAFRLAFWELLHAPDYRSAVLDAANRGGDADTNAAIVGALVGAARGVGDIPVPWIRAVLRAPGLSSEPDDFHPRVFLRGIARASNARTEITELLAPYVAEADPVERVRAEAGQRLEPRPARGDVWPIAGSLDIDHLIRGESRHGQYDGRLDGRRVIVTRVATTATLEEIRAALPSADIPGLAPLVALERVGIDGASPVVAIEARPAGLALSCPGYAMSADRALAVLGELLIACALTHDSGGAIGGVRPEHIFAITDSAGRSRITGLASRGTALARFVDGGGSLGLASPYDDIYDPPEVMGGGSPSPAADVFSACATLYFMVARRSPFAHRDLMGQLVAMQKGPPAIIPAISSELDPVIKAGLAADPGARPSAVEIAAHLEASGVEVGEPPAYVPAPRAEHITHFIVGARPVRRIRRAGGGVRVETVDWKTGELVLEMGYYSRIREDDIDVEQVGADEFAARVAEIRAKLEAD